MSSEKIKKELAFELNRMWEDTHNYEAVVFCKKAYWNDIVKYLADWIELTYDPKRGNIKIEHTGIGHIKLCDPSLGTYRQSDGHDMFCWNHAGMQYTTIIMELDCLNESAHTNNILYMMSRLRSSHPASSRMVMC